MLRKPTSRVSKSRPEARWRRSVPSKSSHTAADRSELRVVALGVLARFIDDRLHDPRGSVYLARGKVIAHPILRPIREGSRELQAEFLMVLVEHALRFSDLSPHTHIGDNQMYVHRDAGGMPFDALAGRTFPLSGEQLLQLAKAVNAAVIDHHMTPGWLLRIFETALGDAPPSPLLRRELRRWRERFGARYGSDGDRLIARLDDLSNRGCTPKKVSQRTITVASRDEAVTILLSHVREIGRAVRVGRSPSFSVPMEWVGLFTAVEPKEAKRILNTVLGRLNDRYDKRDHLARYVTLRSGFANVRRLAPGLCALLRAVYLPIAQLPDEQAVRLFAQPMSDHGVATPVFLRRYSSGQMIESIWLEGHDRPRLFEMFEATILRENGQTDCPTWGDSFEPLEDEAEGPQPFIALPGDAWSNQAIADIAAMTPADRERWLALLHHAADTTWSRPTKRWLASAAALVAALPDFPARLAHWLSLVGRAGTRRTNLWGWPPDRTYLRPRNARLLRGLLWACTHTPTNELAGSMAAAAITGDQRVLRLGPRCAVVRNAAVAALGAMPASIAGPPLVKLDLLLKYKAGKRVAAAAVRRSAEAGGLTIAEYHESTVPTYDFAPNHTAAVTLAGAAVRLRVSAATRVDVVAPAPASDGYREARRHADEIERMLKAHRLRLERLPLLDPAWPLSVWRDRYGDHPLLAFMARRLIWRIDDRAAMWDGQAWRGHDGRKQTVAAAATIRPWHPAAAPPREVLQWRARLEAGDVVQPFKQAHREIYLVTDAERATRTYSNRFAAHIVRGPQLQALMHERGWDGNPASPFDTSQSNPAWTSPDGQWRAEFAVESLEEHATDEPESIGALLGTDRVTITRTNEANEAADDAAAAAPVPLDQVPPLVLSEVLRDVDLFVGVASVGNNPEWSDGGPEGRYRDYWWEYSFETFGETAASRKQLLERVVPRLRIAPVCSFSEKFLIVKGSLRTYKIHLGSGNILMEPNDEYLCIVPSTRDAASTASVFLPFEGDRTLSIILSKAFMLADDTSITDPTITRQIRK